MYSLCPFAGLQIYSPSYDSATSQLDFRQYQGLLRSPDLEPDAFRHEAVSARRIYEFKSYRDGQVSVVERLREAYVVLFSNNNSVSSFLF